MSILERHRRGFPSLCYGLPPFATTRTRCGFLKTRLFSMDCGRGREVAADYHHLFPGISKLIAFDFAPPPTTRAFCKHGLHACCRNTFKPKSSFAYAFVRLGIDLAFFME